MKKLLFILMLIPVIAMAQDVKKEQTKFEAFSSPTGSIVKFYDVNMPRIPAAFGVSLESSIRVVVRGGDSRYFYRIEKSETSSSITRTAMIAYSDLVEINKAIQSLVAEVSSDIQNNPDYLENKFVSEDGLEIGYYVSNGQARWFLKLERYSSSTVFCRDIDTIVKAFSDAQKKIEELRQK